MAVIPGPFQIMKQILTPPRVDPRTMDTDDVLDASGFLILTIAPGLAADAVLRAAIGRGPGVSTMVLSALTLASFGAGLVACYIQAREIAADQDSEESAS